MTLKQFITKKKKEFDKGYYTFQFWFFDKENKKRYETCCVNDPLPPEEAFKMAKRHISEFGRAGICYFFENEMIKDFLSQALTQLAKEMGKAVDIDFEETDECAEKDETLFIDGCNHIIKHLKARIDNFLKE